MATGTTLILVKTGLVTRLTARPVLSGVQVAYTKPGTDPGTELQNEAIWFGEDADSEDGIPVMKAGTKTVHETYFLPAVVQVLRTDGSTQQDCDTRAAALLAELQQELAETPQVVSAVLWAEMAGWSFTGGALGENSSRGSRFETQLKINARLG